MPIFHAEKKIEIVYSTMRTRKRSPLPLSTTYSKEDFSSNDGMLTTVWGPSMWHYLHTMSFNYPVEPSPVEKQNYRNFVLSLQYVLPCGKCRKNLCKNLKKLPLTMECMASRDSFSRFMFQLHENVNAMLHKKSGLTYEQVRERYEHFRARCAIPKTSKLPAKTLKKHPKKESGCTEPLYGDKAKCVLQIVPIDSKKKTLTIDKRCVKHRGGQPVTLP
jgi:hypothetical protein